jgi:hypothetical protein
MRRLIVLCLTLTALLVCVPTASAQGGIAIEDSGHEFTFRERIVFHLDASSDSEINEVVLVYQVQTTRRPVSTDTYPEFTPGTTVHVEHDLDVRAQHYLPPGVEISYYWRVRDAAGHELETEPVVFTYEDNTHDWKELSNDRVALYWYRGSDDFGQTLFDRAVESLDSIERDLDVAVKHRIKLYIYGTYDDLHAALEEGAHEWTGGRSFSGAGYPIILIGIAPNNLDWGLEAIAHELTHAVVAQKMIPPFGGLPHWMDEGLAVYYQGVSSYEQAALEQAIRDNTLLSIRSLNSNFPTDREVVDLAYAESWSVVNFMFEHYGEEKVAELIEVFGVGAHQDDGLMEVLGFDVDGLEDEWRLYIGAPPREGASVEATLLPQQETPAVGTPHPASSPTPTPSRSQTVCCGAAPAALFLTLFLVLRPRPATQG